MLSKYEVVNDFGDLSVLIVLLFLIRFFTLVMIVITLVDQVIFGSYRMYSLLFFVNVFLSSLVSFAFFEFIRPSVF